MDNTRAVLADNLKRLLKEKGLTRRRVSSDLNIPYSSFNEWCNGRKAPRMNNLEKIAAYFGVKKSALLEPYADIKDTLDVLYTMGLTDNEIKEVVNFANYLINKR